MNIKRATTRQDLPGPNPDAQRNLDHGVEADHSPKHDCGTVHIRNYDHQHRYDLVLEVVAVDGQFEFRERYSLRPGQTERLVNVLPAGTYEIRATVDSCYERVRQCTIGTGPNILVEVGNGIVSLTEGTYR